MDDLVEHSRATTGRGRTAALVALACGTAAATTAFGRGPGSAPRTGLWTRPTTTG